MKYLSHRAITWAIDELRENSHPFIGITYLACKKIGLPVGATREMSLDDITKKHLETHHHLDPQSRYYFQPFKSIKIWVAPKYPSGGLQTINTRTFKDVFIYQRRSKKWGFRENYVEKISQIVEEKGSGLMPLLPIAIWMGKNEAWEADATPSSVVEHFLTSYQITDRELRALFNRVSPLLRSKRLLFADDPPDLKSLAYAFGPPPDVPNELEGTLATIRLADIGPAERLELDFGKRLTLIAGDNGLGKSFLLDVAWWAITGKWATRPAIPFGGPRARRRPTIRFEIRSDSEQSMIGQSHFDWESYSWITRSDRPSVSALCIYARADGSFAISDEVRAKLQAHNQSHMNYFTSEDVWNGKAGEIEGLIRDWVNWQLSRDPDIFSKLTRVLERLSPEDIGPLGPGEPIRLPGEPRQIPTVKHPYGEVPILYSSAGVQRILLLAYVALWSWQEHTLAAQQIGEESLQRMVIVVDEIEAHLHPRWQRTMLPALMDVGKLLSEHLEMQLIVSTHSPMILASMESDFSEDLDVLYHLELEEFDVVLEPLDFQKYGDISAWLTSPIFGLRQARSREAEKAIEKAKEVQLTQNPDISVVETISDDLRHLLPPDDPFWPRWVFFAEQFGIDL